MVLKISEKIKRSGFVLILPSINWETALVTWLVCNLGGLVFHPPPPQLLPGRLRDLSELMLTKTCRNKKQTQIAAQMEGTVTLAVWRSLKKKKNHTNQIDYFDTRVFFWHVIMLAVSLCHCGVFSSSFSPRWVKNLLSQGTSWFGHNVSCISSCSQVSLTFR